MELKKGILNGESPHKQVWKDILFILTAFLLRPKRESLSGFIYLQNCGSLKAGISSEREEEVFEDEELMFQIQYELSLQLFLY